MTYDAPGPFKQIHISMSLRGDTRISYFPTVNGGEVWMPVKVSVHLVLVQQDPFCHRSLQVFIWGVLLFNQFNKKQPKPWKHWQNYNIHFKCPNCCILLTVKLKTAREIIMGWFTSDALLAPVPLHKVSLFVGHMGLSINSFRCAVTLKKSGILHFGLGHQKCVHFYEHFDTYICHRRDRVPLMMGWSKAWHQKGAFSCLYATLGDYVIHPSIHLPLLESIQASGATGYTRANGQLNIGQHTKTLRPKAGLKVPIHLSPNACLCTVGESQGTWILLTLKQRR